MTGPHRSDRRAREDERFEELLRADAAAVADDDLEDEIFEEVARGNEEDDGLTLGSRRQKSQVYSIRVPVEQLEQVRVLAKQRGVAPTAMMREWILEKLQSEAGETVAKRSATGPERSARQAEEQNSYRRSFEMAVQRIETALVTFIEAAAQLTTVLARSAEASAAEPRRFAASNRSPLLPNPQWPILKSHHAWPPHSQEWLIANAWLPTDPNMGSGAGHVLRGVAALRATIESASEWPGLADQSLYALYKAADEELSKS
jgi:hypothetical protein